MKKVCLLLALVSLLCIGCVQETPPVSSAATQADTPRPQVAPPIETSAVREPIEIAILYDDEQFDRRTKPALGLSCFIRLPNENILFDTGSKADLLLYNMEQLGIRPGDIDSIFLSHDHPDHVGGLMGVLEKKNNLTVYAPKSASGSLKDRITASGARLQEISETSQIVPGVFTTGELGDMIKEQSLVMRSSEGLILIAGCAHPRIVNIIKTVQRRFPNEKMYLVMGGFHFVERTSVMPPQFKSLMTTDQLRLVVNSFKNLGVLKVGPCHCSGDEARNLFRQQFGDDYIDIGAGRILELPSLEL